MSHSCQEFKFKLASGQDVYWNRISGYAIETDHCLLERPYLHAPTKREALEIAQIVADDDVAFREECDRDKEAGLR